MDMTEVLWEKVVMPSWRAYCSCSFGDKKVWLTGFIHGASGVGKTRFNLKFLGLLADHLALTHQPAPNNEVESL
jgi:hypothetical protein